MKMLLIPFVALFAGTNAFVASTDGLNEAAPLWMPVFNACGFVAVTAFLLIRSDRTQKAQTIALERNTQALMIVTMGMKLLNNTGIIEMAQKIKDDAHDHQQKLEGDSLIKP